MTKTYMNAQQVKAARERALAGVPVTTVAAEMGLPYSPVYQAIIGKTWSSIHFPPPVSGEVFKQRRKRPTRICGNCGGAYQVGGTTTRCRACYAHLRRHGAERVTEFLRKHRHARVSKSKLAALYERYRAGASTETLAEGLPFCAETLRRRFVAAGYKMRNNVETKRKLSPGLVRQARRLANVEGVPISKIARQMGVDYQTIRDAIKGTTWRAAGGPLPEGEAEQGARPCRVCEMLTTHSSGACRYCRPKATQCLKQEGL